METLPNPLRYLYEYVDLIEEIKNKKPGFFPAFLESHRAARQASEVSATDIIREWPTDEELLQETMTKFNLVPWNPSNYETSRIQTYFVARKRKTSEVETQTPPEKKYQTIATQTSPTISNPIATQTSPTTSNTTETQTPPTTPNIITTQTSSPPPTRKLAPSASTSKISPFSPPILLPQNLRSVPYYRRPSQPPETLTPRQSSFSTPQRGLGAGCVEEPTIGTRNTSVHCQPSVTDVEHLDSPLRTAPIVPVPPPVCPNTAAYSLPFVLRILRYPSSFFLRSYSYYFFFFSFSFPFTHSISFLLYRLSFFSILQFFFLLMFTIRLRFFTFVQMVFLFYDYKLLLISFYAYASLLLSPIEHFFATFKYVYFRFTLKR